MLLLKQLLVFQASKFIRDLEEYRNCYCNTLKSGIILGQAVSCHSYALGAYISAGLQKARILLENSGQADGRVCRNLAAGQAGAELIMGYNCA